MSQTQLEAVVDFLAEAERKAAARLESEKAAVQKRLDELRKQLAQTARQRLEVLEKKLQQEAERSEEETAMKIAALEDETTARIEVMRKRHKRVRDGLVAWAVERIADHA